MASATTASRQAGMWLGEFAAAVQGTLQAMNPRPRQQQQKQLGGENNTAAVQVAAAAGGKAAKDRDVVRRCGAAMSDTTLCLLLDRR
ncbi:hypothetical protein BAE44_0004935 [Dichanthelium oligosanthes]|uniref:Uncharacterized protein n=1 Tax=Dichanthelium oligosanthes TaxID=888268 RepID=A0A1E5W9L2_9POAL|nr:hypothetical protein BAE44_0004935 [Dichanthelium oligosanthes]